MFPENDSNMSRQQFQICKDEMQNYYIENMHKNILLLIRVTSVKQIVRKGFTYHFPKKNKVLVEDITPNQQIYSEGISQINPALDWCQVDLKANISQPEAQNTNDQEYEIYFKYNNIQYHCRSSKFTIGNSLSDDIQIETAELGEQIVFQYIDNYGWVVYEPKSTNIGTFVNPNFSDIQKNQETLKLQKNDSDSNLVANNQQINPKFLIFDGIQFQLADYEFRLNFQK